MPEAGQFIRASHIARWLDYAEITATSNTTTGGPVDTTGLTVTVSVVAGRRYKITLTLNGVRSDVANDNVQATICLGDNTRLAGNGRTPAHNANVSCNGGTLVATHVPAASGSQTYKCRHERVTGTGSVAIGAGADLPSFILVEEMIAV